MRIEVGIDFLQQIINVFRSLLYPSETPDIIRRDILQHLGNAPVNIGFDKVQGLLAQLLHINLNLQVVKINWLVLREKAKEIGDHQIVYPLHISTRRVLYVPNIQAPRQHHLSYNVFSQLRFRQRPSDIAFNHLGYFPIIFRLYELKVVNRQVLSNIVFILVSFLF